MVARAGARARRYAGIGAFARVPRSAYSRNKPFQQIEMVRFGTEVADRAATIVLELFYRPVHLVARVAMETVALHIGGTHALALE